MGLFYAYIGYVNSRGNFWSFATFVDREAADEWWRTISVAHSPYAKSVKRISPQFYVQHDGDRSVVYFFDDASFPDAKQFLDKVFFIYINTTTSWAPVTIPLAEVTDHISGRWYFIRSKGDSLSHWYLRIGGSCLVCGSADCDAIHVSSEHRTKFCVRVRNIPDGFQVPEHFVMIGKDEVSIAAPKDHTVHVDEGDLRETEGYQGGLDLLFSDLKDRFIKRAEKQINGEIWDYVESVEKGLGETWELVD